MHQVLKLKKRTIHILISVVVTAAILFLIYHKISGRLTAIDIGYSASLMFDSVNTILLLVSVILLMPVNLLCEAMKWKTVTKPLMPMSVVKAYSGILAGITAGLLLPNRVGEFAGKSLVLPLSLFWKGSVLAIFTSMTQLMMTLVFGLLGVYHYGPELNHYFGITVSVLPSAIAITGIVILLFLYFNIQLIAGFFIRWKKLYKVISVIETVKIVPKLEILGLSILRYFVFAGQNLLLLAMFDVQVPLVDAFFLIALMYLVMTAVPTIAVTDLPARGSVMLLLFISWFEINGLGSPYALEAKIMLASFTIWLVNLIIPALPGLYFLNKLSVLRKETK